jgi:hypothetical protein
MHAFLQEITSIDTFILQTFKPLQRFICKHLS